MIVFGSSMQALENGSITVKVPEKYWSCQGHQLCVPLSCGLWACSEPAQKTGHQEVLDPLLNPGHTIKVCYYSYRCLQLCLFSRF